MISMIITGHGSFADGMHSAVRLIAGDCDGLRTVCFPESDSTDDLRAKLTEAIGQSQGELLILTDIAGGSPFNAAAALRAQYADRRIEVLSGANIPLVLSAVMEREGKTLDELIPDLMETAKFGIRHFVLKAPVAPPPQDGEEDGI